MITLKSLILLFPPIFLPLIFAFIQQPTYPKFEYLSVDTAIYQYPEWIDMVREKGREGWELVEVEAGVFIFARPMPYSSKWEYLASGPGDPFPYPDTQAFLADYGGKGWGLTAIYEGAYIFKRVQVGDPPAGH